MTRDDRTFMWTIRFKIMLDSVLLPAYLLSVDSGKKKIVTKCSKPIVSWYTGKKRCIFKRFNYFVSFRIPKCALMPYAACKRCLTIVCSSICSNSSRRSKNERYHDSALARFFLLPALTKSLEMRQSVYVMKKLEGMEASVKTESSSSARKEKLHQALHHAILPETFQLPLRPDRIARL
ncbi:hypothetical protein PsorP6_008020 [Peronosclerospora sorghi]|uniref:Uncharacterized protein n=1 Tax=Peronosclerospora sorghi TaxID=230839 RepID=A0ACC0WBI4_9STRA|nr:hypothetical protein PsorP6_008020 [Peronosclerospora sorghi]